MTTVLSVDLAAQFSAAVLRGPGGEVSHQFDSRDKLALTFCREISADAALADIIVVEDVPYGISNQNMIKPALRLQGALCAYLTARNALDRTVFMSPNVWMKDFPGVSHSTTKGLSKAASDQERIDTAAFHALQAGYTPPDLVGAWEAECREVGRKILKKDTNPLAKSMTDYVSAWLMSEFTRRFTLTELRVMPGVQRATL